MEFISAEEFLKQGKEVQKVLLEWWKPSVGDLVSDKEGVLKGVFSIFDNHHVDTVSTDKYKVIPNLVEGQLRQFIEDKYNLNLILSMFQKNWLKIKTHITE